MEGGEGKEMRGEGAVTRSENFSFPSANTYVFSFEPPLDHRGRRVKFGLVTCRL